MNNQHGPNATVRTPTSTGNAQRRAALEAMVAEAEAEDLYSKTDRPSPATR